jgi:hypothetical protein
MSSGDMLLPAINGKVNPAAVMPATVAEPIAKRNKAARPHVNIKGFICSP